MALKIRTLQDGATATGVGKTMPVGGREVVLLEVYGTFTATITVQGALRDSWYPIDAVNMAGQARATTITGEGLYLVATRGLKAIRANITSYSNGTVNVEAGGE